MQEIRSLWQDGFLDHGIQSMKGGNTTSVGGTTYKLSDFKPSYVDIGTIVHTLSRYPRYVGHTNKLMSVAQHSARGFMAALLTYRSDDEEYTKQLAASMIWHDASEAYTGDISKPLKKLMEDKFTPLEHAIEKVISDVLDTPFPYTDGYKVIDTNMALDEMVTMIKNNKFYDYWGEQRSVAELTYCWHWISSVTDMKTADEFDGLLGISNSSLYYLMDSLILIGRLDQVDILNNRIFTHLYGKVSVDHCKHSDLSMKDVTEMLDDDIKSGVNTLLFFLEDKKHTIGTSNYEHTYIEAAHERAEFYKKLKY